MIYHNSVDLIVVGANKLEAKRIFDTLKEVAGRVKMFGAGEDLDGGDNDGDMMMEEGGGGKKK